MFNYLLLLNKATLQFNSIVETYLFFNSIQKYYGFCILFNLRFVLYIQNLKLVQSSFCIVSKRTVSFRFLLIVCYWNWSSFMSNNVSFCPDQQFCMFFLNALQFVFAKFIFLTYVNANKSLSTICIQLSLSFKSVSLWVVCLKNMVYMR